MGALELHPEGDISIVVTRRFAAKPEDVHRAHVETGLLRQRMLGPEGWSMPVCVSDARPDGGIRFEWPDGEGAGFHSTGEDVAPEPFGRLVPVERMVLPQRTPDNRVETRFAPKSHGTRMTIRMTLPDSETRDALIDSGVADGIEASYARLEEVPASGPR